MIDLHVRDVGRVELEPKAPGREDGSEGEVELAVAEAG